MKLNLYLFSVVFYGSVVAQVIRIEPRDGGTLNEGDELSLSCILEDPLFTNINWFKEKVQLSEGRTSLRPDEYNLTHSSTSTNGLQQFILHVQSVTKYNDGLLKCKASKQNGGPIRVKKYQLNVLYEPHIKYPQCNLSISQQFAECESEIGNPEILLQWRHHKSTVSNLFADIESQNRKIDKFMHKQTVYFYNFPSPQALDDSIVCVLRAQPERNCSIFLREVYDSFDPPIISSNMTVLATEDATVSCSTNLTLANVEFVFQYETFPHNRSLLYAKNNSSVTFTAIPVGIESIHISCLFKWGLFDSLKSDLTFITVLQPTTTPNPLKTSSKINLPTTPSITTPSLSSQSQLLKQLPTTESYTTQSEPKHNIPDLSTLEPISTDHQNHISTQTYSQSPKMSPVSPSIFRNKRTEYVPDGLDGTSPLSTELDMLPTDLLTTGKLTTFQFLEGTSLSDTKTIVMERDNSSDLSTQVNQLSTVSVSTPLLTKLLTKTTAANEIKRTPPIAVDTNPPEKWLTDFATTNLYTTAQDSMTNSQSVLMTKAETPSVPSHLSTKVHDLLSTATFYPIVPSKVATVISTSSKVTFDATSPHQTTTSHQGSSPEQDAILSPSTKKNLLITDKRKHPDTIKTYPTEDHLNNKPNGKGINVQGTNNDSEDKSDIYLVVICCGCVSLIMIGIYVVRRKTKSGEYQVDT